MGRRRKPKKIKVEIVYPPVPTRRWIPPDRRKKRKRPKPPPYPPQMTAKLELSSLKKIWHSYDIIHDCAVLIGHFSQGNRKFGFISNGFQGAPNCVMAVLFSKLIDCPYWDKFILDGILTWGDGYYLDCRKRFKQKQHLTLCDLQRELYLFNYKIFVDFRGIKYNVLLYNDSNPQDYLQNAIKEFFENNESGVICAPGNPGRFFAIWKYENGYFLFDPTDHDTMCWPWKGIPGAGFCFLVRFTNTDKLVQVVQRNLPNNNMLIELCPVGIERIVSINTTYPDCLADANLEAIDPKLEKLNRSDSIIIKKQPKEVVEPEEPKVELPEEDQDPLDPLAAVMPLKKEGEEAGVLPELTKLKRKAIVEKPRVASITYFNHIGQDRIGILLADTHQGDPDFKACPEKQGISNAVAALTMLRQLRAKYWTSRILTQVLRLGFRICRLTKMLSPIDQEISLKNIVKQIELNEKRYTAHVTQFGAVGRLTSKDESMLELLPAMKEVLLECDTLVVQGPLVVAVWRQDGFYFMFDPNERDPSGNVIVKEMRVGSVMEAVDFIGGASCLTKFTDLKDLVDLYMANVDRNSRRDPFVISNVEMRDYVELPTNWGEFKAITEDRWILRGNFSQSDRRFERQSRNTQCTANCVMAIAYAHAIPLNTWTAETMDTILMCGNDYYINCVEELQRKGLFVSHMLMLVELMTEFIADNKLAVIDINECLINGFITMDDSYKNTRSLKQGLSEFFHDNDFGVFTCRGSSVALFRKGDAYFYFDSHDRDAEGFYKPHGKCCVQRFTNTDTMAEIIMGTLGPDEVRAIYNISRIDVSLYDPPPPDAKKDEDDDDGEDILEENKDQNGINLQEKFNIEIPAYKYTKITKKRAILRGKFHQAVEEHFGTNAGKQTVPNLISAVATSRVFDPRHWNQERLNEILFRGNALYDQSMDVYYKAQAKMNLQGEGGQDEDESDEITMDNVVKDVKIGLNKITATFETVAEGQMDDEASVIVETLDRLLKEDPEDVNDNKELIVHTDMFDVIVWKQDGLHYLFDPKPRDERGEIYGKEQWDQPKPEIVEEPVEEEEMPEEADAGDDIAKDVEQEKVIATQDLQEPDAKPEMAEGFAYMEEQMEGQQEGEAPGDEQNFKYPQKYWEEMEYVFGKACVIWFSKLKLLIKHIVGNNPPTLRKDYNFKITRVKLTNEIEVKEPVEIVDSAEPAAPKAEVADKGDWYNFAEICTGYWILRGTMHQKNVLFPERNRGKQNDANCLLSLVFAALYGLSQYTKNTVDAILKYGDRLYTATKKVRRRELEKITGTPFTDGDIDDITKYDVYNVHNLVKNVCIGNDNVLIAIGDELISGEVHAQELLEVLDVQRGLEKFFTEGGNQYGVMSAKGLSVGLWKIRDCYYMFDPCERGPDGGVFASGVACITRFADMVQLVDLFLKNLPKIGKSYFSIYSVTIVGGVCNKPIRVEIKRVDDPLKVTGFTPVVPGKMIIRGSIHQDLSRFGRGINMQCSPIAMVALAMTLIHSTEFWTRLIIDDIIIIGDKIYGELLERCDFDFNPWEEKLTLSMSPKDFKIGKIKVNCETRLTEQRGVIDTKNPTVLNLRQGIERFFSENSYGIIETDFLTVAIWEPDDSSDTNYLYMFDPNQRSQTGQPTQENGTGCCMKFCGAKTMSDHIVSLIQHDREGSYVITPVEIVMERDGKFKKTRRYGIDKKLELRPDSHKQKQLGRHTFYKIPDTQCEILRGTRSQASKCYPDSTRGFQDVPNCIVSYVMDKLIPLVRWNCKTIDMILDIGDQLYKDSYVVYDPQDKKLRIETLVRDVVIRDVRVSISVGAPIIAAQFQMKALMEALDACFNLKPFCIVLADQSAISIFKKEDMFYLFDPMDLDLSGNRVDKGCAAVLRFEDMAVMVIHLMKNLQINGVKDRFHIVIVGIKEIRKVGFKFGEGHPNIVRPTNKCLCDKSMYAHVRKSEKSKLAEVLLHKNDDK